MERIRADDVRKFFDGIVEMARAEIAFAALVPVVNREFHSVGNAAPHAARNTAIDTTFDAAGNAAVDATFHATRHAAGNAADDAEAHIARRGGEVGGA